MRLLIPRTRRVLDRLQERFIRSRPGSVLVLVIALLVLLALIGTAYISTTRVDRAASAQNSSNVEIDLLLQGVIQMVEGMIVDDVAPSGAFRQAGTSYATYNHPSIDKWLSDRVPTVLDPTKPLDLVGPPQNLPVWRYVVQPPVSAGNFESPVNRFAYTASTNMLPTYVTLTDANGQAAPYPALKYYDPTTGTWGDPIVAADTDYDGIADAPLFRLPMSQLQGVTFYAGFRVVDNLAALNASVAWRPNSSPTDFLNNNFFPTNVDLGNFLASSGELDNYNTGYRFNTLLTANLTPINEAGTTRADFNFFSQEEALWNQLGRRVQYPGNNGPDPSSNMTKYQALSPAESIVMARRFVLRDPNSSPSKLEQYLQTSVYNTPTRTQAYQPTAWTAAQYLATPANWYNDNFAYVPGPQPLCLRSMLVARNPMSNYVPGKFRSRGIYDPNAAGTQYTFGDWVTYNGRAYVCVNDFVVPTPANPIFTPSTTPANTTPLDPNTQYYTDTQYWAFEPWLNAPVKTCANTATFEQLWLAYWNVMCDAQNSPPSTLVNPASPPAATPADPRLNVGLQMFRSSVRNPAEITLPAAPTVPGLSALQEVQLRAALAAVNTLDIRTTSDANSTPSSGNISLMDYSKSPPTPEYTVTLFGTKPQPYVTEVFANNDPTINAAASPPTTGYIAIELYNPYPYDIPLTNWKLQTISRKGTGAGLTPADVVSTTSWTATPPTVPAGGYIVLANSEKPAAYTSSPTASSSATPKTLYVLPDLDQAFDSELVLVRPTATPVTATTVFAPVDSYDFTGLIKPSTIVAPAKGDEWHYIRPNSIAAIKAWHFIYPGPFDPSKGTDGVAGSDGTPRLRATTRLPVATAGIPPSDALASLGAPDASALSVAGVTYRDIPLQLNNVFFGGPNKIISAPTKFPFGEFARNGDILQVPFIGAYKIVDNASGKTLELNSTTMDSTMAAATDDGTTLTALNPQTQDVGRFVPITIPVSALDPYYWAARIFDYLTVQAPNDDYLPNTDADRYLAGSTPEAVPNMKKGIANAVVTPTNQTTEDVAPIDGLININTASWRLLAALPMVDDAPTNADLAKAIVYYRDIDDGSISPWNAVTSYVINDKVMSGGIAYKAISANVNTSPPNATYWAVTSIHAHGPFKSIWELNSVAFNQPPNINAYTGIHGGQPIAFRTNFGEYDGSTAAKTYNDPTAPPPAVPTDGDLSPLANVLWASAQAYVAGNTVLLSNGSGASPYVCIQAHTSDATNKPPNTTFWAPLNLNDFEMRNLALTRISNLITTRSDSFTVYVTVQGWKNVNSSAVTHWTAGQAYTPGNKVTDGGSNYRCILAHTAAVANEPPNVTYWKPGDPQLVIQRRAAFIVDRSGMTPTNKSLAVTTVPMN